jgi:hypothetical protein
MSKKDKEPSKPQQPEKKPEGEELLPEDLEQISGGPITADMPQALKLQ